MTSANTQTLGALDARMLIENYTTGDRGDWVQEFSYLLDAHGPQLAALLASLASEGQQRPIAVEPTEKRVLDGHHRILCALILGIPIQMAYGYEGMEASGCV